MSWRSISISIPNSINNAAALADLPALATHVQSVLIHPFQYGVGEGDMPNVLSFPNAINALSNKLSEADYDGAVCIAFAENSVKKLADKVKDAVENIGLFWLLTVQQRAELLTALDKEKYTITEPSLTPVIVRNEHTVLHAQKLAECYTAKAIELVTEESKTAIGEIAAELEQLATKKADSDAITTSALSAVEIGSVDGYALKLSGSNLAGQLRSANGPGSEKSLTAILCFMGSDEQLTLISELVGL